MWLVVSVVSWAGGLFGQGGPVSLTVRADPVKVAAGGMFVVELVLRSSGGEVVVFEAPVLSEVRNAQVVSVTVEDVGEGEGRLRRYGYALRAGRKGEAVFGTVAVRYREGGREGILVSPVVTVEVGHRGGVAPFLVFVGVLLVGGVVVPVAWWWRRRTSGEGGGGGGGGGEAGVGRWGLADLASLPLAERYGGYLRLLRAWLAKRCGGGVPETEEGLVRVLGEDGREVARVLAVEASVCYGGRRLGEAEVEEVRRLLERLMGGRYGDGR